MNFIFNTRHQITSFKLVNNIQIVQILKNNSNVNLIDYIKYPLLKKMLIYLKILLFILFMKKFLPLIIFCAIIFYGFYEKYKNKVQRYPIIFNTENNFD